MSISTCSSRRIATYTGMATTATPRSLKSAHFSKSRADVKQNSPAVIDGWASELSGRILPYGATVDEWIDTLLPCSTPYTLDDDIHHAFSSYRPEKGKEIREYPRLRSGLRKVVESFEEDRRLNFVGTHLIQMNFPFDAFVNHHHFTRPDFSVSFPGRSLSPITWQNISMVIEAKGEERDDPFPRSGFKNIRTVEQLAKSARNIMLANGFLSAFVVGIYGTIVRLARFDHACALVSRPFDIKNGGAKVLQKFLWHFTHPLVGNTVVGADPTVMPLDSESQIWVKAQLEKVNAKNWTHHVGELSKGRRVEVYDEKTGKCVPYLLYHLVDVNGRLFSRATMVWRAIEDTRIWKDGRLIPDPTCTTKVKPRILKEAWRQVVRTAEAQFYRRLDAKVPSEKWYGLPKMVCGGDIGMFEFRWWAETKARQVERSSTANHTAMDIQSTEVQTSTASPSQQTPLPPSPSSQACSYTAQSIPLLFSSIGSAQSPPVNSVASGQDYIPGEDFPLPHPLQQTYSWRLVQGAASWHRERSHMRMVIDDVGRPLTEFTSTRELVRAMRDAIIGHKIAWQEARLLHRDVSVGNILIKDDPEESDFIGFVHDFDYSSMESDASDSDNECSNGSKAAPCLVDPLQTGHGPDDLAGKKERTGTFYFMSYEILVHPNSIHDAHHDLESFYWVLIWVFVRHTDHGDFRGSKLCDTIFNYGSDDDSASAKRDWLERAVFDVAGNRPLTYLLTELTALVLENIPTSRRNAVRTLLTYDAMLDVFDKALDMPYWPENDWRECTLLKGDGRTGLAPILATTQDGSTARRSECRHPRSQPVHFATSGSNSRDRCRLPPHPLRSALPSPHTGPITRSRSKRSLSSSAGDDGWNLHSVKSLVTMQSEAGESESCKRRRTNGMGPPQVANTATSQIGRSGSSWRTGGTRDAHALGLRPTRSSSSRREGK
ncbi:hypothetical protein BD414DRAFT_35729 [Trametes punicea]|nr:hypothetical protein BD414DRAFT_35729 [Trametes punicea]